MYRLNGLIPERCWCGKCHIRSQTARQAAYKWRFTGLQRKAYDASNVPRFNRTFF